MKKAILCTSVLLSICSLQAMLVPDSNTSQRVDHQMIDQKTEIQSQNTIPQSDNQDLSTQHSVSSDSHNKPKYKTIQKSVWVNSSICRPLWGKPWIDDSHWEMRTVRVLDVTDEKQAKVDYQKNPSDT